jgi:hypothetical protein
VKKDGCVFTCASEELKNDREVVLAAVNQQGCALRYASNEFRNDREIVIAAVNRDGCALWHVSDELKNDREVVIAAVKKDGCAFECASEERKRDHHVLVYALAYGRKNIRCNTPQLKWFVGKTLQQSERFMKVFLVGWHLSNKGAELHRISCGAASNKLPLLNKLGKYESIYVKKLIANYAGVYYGSRLVAARMAWRKLRSQSK